MQYIYFGIVAKGKMRGGVCHFVYLKKNGELREAFGTLTPALVEATTTKIADVAKLTGTSTSTVQRLKSEFQIR